MSDKTESTINGNLADCIHGTSNFGSTVYHNICNGATHVVPWGGADWFLAVFMCSICVMAVGMLLFICSTFIKDNF